MKFNYQWLLFFLCIFLFSCKKETTTDPIDPIAPINYSSYYFGKYHPSCGIVPPCSNRFWLINQLRLVQFGDMPTNIFTSIDSLGQVDASLLNDLTNQTSTSTEPAFEGIKSIIDKVRAINLSCYTFDNATFVPNLTNYFVLIPLEGNHFQLINLHNCHNNLSEQEQVTTTAILDWIISIDQQIGW